MKKLAKLTLIFLFSQAGIAPWFFAQGLSGSEVSLSFYPQTPVVGQSWLISLQIDYPEPDSVAVLEPLISPLLFLESVSQNRQELPAGAQTVVEFRFVPINPGNVTLQAFTVLSPQGLTQTLPVSVTIAAQGVVATEDELLRPAVSWEGLPAAPVVGEPFIFYLRVADFPAPLPPAGFFMPDIPPGIILESLNPQAAALALAEGGGFLLSFRLIALSPHLVYLPARSLRHGNLLFEIPALHINASSPPPAVIVIEAGLEQAALDGDAAFAAPDFPAIDPILYGRFPRASAQEEIEALYNLARTLWEDGRQAQALAQLRRGERDHPSGSILIPIRIEAEESLGFFNTNDENRLRRRIPMFFLGLSFFFATILSLVCFWFRNSAFIKKAALLGMAVFAIAGFFSFYRVINPLPGERSLRGARYAVATETPVRRAPSYAGEQIYIFRQGQPLVILRGNNTPWVWAVANEAGGAAGWVPADAVVFY
ncbi:MAG: hypothetical protein FWG66_10365 [Spirochaetes bacterium]|nr:hypothetical protein [Spirochaetota bacterium]